MSGEVKAPSDKLGSILRIELRREADCECPLGFLLIPIRILRRFQRIIEMR